jgi:large subunit ribosomal protein L17
MSYSNPNRKFGRETNQRRALLRSLAISLIKEEKIKTTEAKAKEIRPLVEKIITTGKADTLASRRLIQSRLGSEEASVKVLKELSPKYKERAGGYTRIVKLPRRKSDASPMAYIEFV